MCARCIMVGSCRHQKEIATGDCVCECIVVEQQVNTVLFLFSTHHCVTEGGQSVACHKAAIHAGGTCV
eukprot:m.1232356 g.1232356  ORF g.1232356 m.1232356 type:complete len:68 (-) comp24660_c0_seq15:3550-3753(-)